MHEVSADEFRISHPDDTSGFPGRLCPGGKDGLFLRDGKDPAVGDGDLVGIAAKVFDGITESVKSLFDIRAPVLFVKAVPESIPFIGVAESFTGPGKGESSFPVQVFQHGKIFSPELIPEDMDREEELLF